jgi:hypothetical protein
MSVSGVENSGQVYTEQVKSRQTEKRVSSEEQDERVRENDSQQERRTSEPGRGENVDVTA